GGGAVRNDPTTKLPRPVAPPRRREGRRKAKCPHWPRARPLQYAPRACVPDHRRGKEMHRARQIRRLSPGLAPSLPSRSPPQTEQSSRPRTPSKRYLSAAMRTERQKLQIKTRPLRGQPPPGRAAQLERSVGALLDFGR